MIAAAGWFGLQSDARPAERPLARAAVVSSPAPAAKAEEPESATAIGTPPPILVEALADAAGAESTRSPSSDFPAHPASCPVLETAATTAPGRFPVSSSWYEGASWFRRVSQERDKTHAPLLVYFYTDWCGFCRNFERNLLGDNTVDRFLRDRIVKLRVNPEKSAENQALANRFGVTGYPSLFVTTEVSDGRRVGIFAERSEGGEAVTRPPDSFIADLQRAESAISRRFFSAAVQTWQAGDARAAIEQLDAALTLTPDDPQLFLMRGEAYLADGSKHRGLRDLRAASDLGPGSVRPFSVLARYLAAHSEWDESVACWNEVIERRPDAAAFAGRARSHAGRGDRPRARVDAALACSQGDASGCALHDELAS